MPRPRLEYRMTGCRKKALRASPARHTFIPGAHPLRHGRPVAPDLNIAHLSHVPTPRTSFPGRARQGGKERRLCHGCGRHPTATRAVRGKMTAKPTHQTFCARSVPAMQGRDTDTDARIVLVKLLSVADSVAEVLSALLRMAGCPATRWVGV